MFHSYNVSMLIILFVFREVILCNKKYYREKEGILLMAREKFILMSELTEEQKAKNFLC